MVLENVTADELSIAIQRVGAGEVAKLGYFHALPYGEGGSGGDTNVLMIEAHVVQDFQLPRGVGILRYDYPVVRTNPSFVDVLILDAGPPSPDSLTYEINVVVNTGQTLGIQIISKWYDPNKVDDLPEFDQRIAVRIEEFKPSVRMVSGLVV